MSFATGFRGTAGGSVQTAYTDQPGVAVPGMLAFAADMNMVDAFYVGTAAGVRAGAFVKLSAVSDDVSLQRPNDEAVVVETGDDYEDCAGVVVFNEAMQSDENGDPGWAHGRMCQVLRKGRLGSRIYMAARAAIARTDTPYMVTVADTAAVYKVGDVCTSSLGGGAAGTSTTLAAVCKFVTAAAAGGVVCIEML
jgi:hypothetical protein